ncbi:MAG: major facilitator superfamily 1 [Chloroflexi bacterium]|nr:major facilitator superfamily 1 [Chloroflexota bacterium]
MSKDTGSGGGVYTRQNFLSMYLPSITLAIGTGIVIPALPVYARNFGVPFEVASLVLVAQQVGTTLASLPAGLLMDRFGRRKVVLSGPVVLALSSLLMVTAQSFPELLAYRFLAGVGQQMWHLGRLTIIADTGADRERGRQITTMSAMESSGRLLSPALGGFLAAYWDIRAPFVIHAILCLIAIIPSFKLIRETAPHLAAGAARTVQKTADAGWGALFTFAVVIFFVAQFLASLTRGPIFSGQINLYGAYIYDLGPETIGLLATAVTAVSIPIGLASGWIMDKYGRKATLVPGFLLLTVALVCIAVTAYVDVPFEVFIAAYLGVHASNSITGGNMQTLGSDIAPTNARGRFYGVWQTLGNVGSPISTSLFAVLSATVSYWAAFGAIALMAAGTAFILATLVHDRLRDKPATAVASAA